MTRALLPFAVLAFALVPVDAAAQSSPGAQGAPRSEGISVGEWTFRPSFELRLRGELRRYPLDAGGKVPTRTAVLGEAPEPVDATPIEDEWTLTERARLGLSVDRGPVTAVVRLQDARGLGTEATAAGDGRAPPREPGMPSLEPHEAYLEVHALKGRRMFLRVGRQRVTWGDGRLLGDDDWSATARSLDAARFGVEVGDFDVELLAALLAAPDRGGSGAQLYGLDGIWHLSPLLSAELTGLARVVRTPFPATLTPGDTIVIDGRVFGDHRGFRYAVEGAYELGRVATIGDNRKLSALALAARAELETALPAHLTFGAQAAYASGDTSPLAADATQTRFDPLLPDQHGHHGLMDAYAWSNLIELGGDVAVRPADELGLTLAYRYAGLAEATGRWSNAALIPIGSSPTNTASTLGHEIDASVRLTPWDAVTAGGKPPSVGARFDAGYSLFFLGEGAKNIVREAGRFTPSTAHYAFVTATVTAP